MALGLIMFNWVLCLFDFHAIIPEKIGDLIFLSVRIVVSVLGVYLYKKFNLKENQLIYDTIK